MALFQIAMSMILLQAVQAFNIHINTSKWRSQDSEQSASPVFIADEEARDDLCSLGMADACASQIAASAHGSSLAYARFAKPGHRWQLQLENHCHSPHRMVYHHVMKSGGVSVRKFLECVCAGKHCGILRMDGQRGLDQQLDTSCEPAICTSHANSHDWSGPQRCGPKFLEAQQFTLLRHPVERVWSFYNYLRRYYKPFQERSLLSILQNLGKEDLDEGLPVGHRCKYCGVQLSNAMTSGMFCGLNPQACEDLRRGHATAQDKFAALDAAKGVLQRMSAIFLFEDINEFPTTFERSQLPFHEGVGTMLHCDIGQDNPTKYTEGDKPVMNSETRAWIERLNSDDIELFHFARRLPIVIRPHKWRRQGVAPFAL